MKKIHTLAFILVVVGSLNWLLVGIMPTWDLGNIVSVIGARIVYILVGLSAIYLVVSHKSDCKHCEPSAPTTSM